MYYWYGKHSWFYVKLAECTTSGWNPTFRSWKVTLNIAYSWLQCRGMKTCRMPWPFWLSSDSTAMFALIFMTSTGVPLSLDSIKVCPLPPVNNPFMAGEVRESRNKHYMDETHFLTSSAFYQARSCSVTCRDRQSSTSIWLTSSTHLPSVTHRLV